MKRPECIFGRGAHRWSIPCRLLPNKDLVAYCQFCFREKFKRWNEKSKKYFVSFNPPDTYFDLQMLEQAVAQLPPLEAKKEKQELIDKWNKWLEENKHDLRINKE